MIVTERGRHPLVPGGRAVAAAVLAQLAPWALGATPALAAEGGSGNPWMDLLWKAVNFLVLAGIIYYFARKPVGNLMRGAAKESKDTLDEQRERAAGAEAEAAEQRRRIENLEADLQRMLNESREEARSEHERLVAEARNQSERIRHAVSTQVEQEFNKARKELQAELAQETVRLADTMIRERMDDRRREQAADRAIEQLGARP